MIREKVKRNELPTTAADLIPPVRNGLVASGTTKAGARFIQPWVELDGDRKLLDDVTDGQWRLLVNSQRLSKSNQTLLSALQQQIDIQATLLTNLECDALSTWLADADAQAVLLRPDHYVFGTATESSLGELLNTLANQLFSSSPLTSQEAAQ